MIPFGSPRSAHWILLSLTCPLKNCGLMEWMELSNIVGRGPERSGIGLFEGSPDATDEGLGVFVLEVGPLTEGQDRAAGGPETSDGAGVGQVEADELDVVADGVMAIDGF